MPLYNCTDAIIIITACHNCTQPQLLCSHATCISSMLSQLLLHESIALFSPFIVQQIWSNERSRNGWLSFSALREFLCDRLYIHVVMRIFLLCLLLLFRCSMCLLVCMCWCWWYVCNNLAAFICVGGLLFIVLNVNHRFG